MSREIDKVDFELSCFNTKMSLILSIRYRSKMREYIVDVQSKKDSRNKGSIFYYTGNHISDDYHFRIEREQEEMLQKMFKIIRKEKTNISIEDMSLDVGRTLLKNKFSKRDIYSGDEAIRVGLTIKPSGIDTYYESKEAFSKDVYDILKIFKDLGFPYENIQIKSFLADGNTSYRIVIEDAIKVNSLEDIMGLMEKNINKRN